MRRKSSLDRTPFSIQEWWHSRTNLQLVGGAITALLLAATVFLALLAASLAFPAFLPALAGLVAGIAIISQLNVVIAAATVLLALTLIFGLGTYFAEKRAFSPPPLTKAAVPQAGPYTSQPEQEEAHAVVENTMTAAAAREGRSPSGAAAARDDGAAGRSPTDAAAGFAAAVTSVRIVGTDPASAPAPAPAPATAEGEGEREEVVAAEGDKLVIAAGK